jgi:hypothetical protein
VAPQQHRLGRCPPEVWTTGFNRRGQIPAPLARGADRAKKVRPEVSSTGRRAHAAVGNVLALVGHMLVARLRTWVTREHRRFEALVESQGQHGRVSCPRSGESRELDRCARCVHFAGLRPGPRGLLLRCLTTDDDAVMARTAGWHGVTVDAEMTHDQARDLARRHDRLILPVVDRGMVVGVVYRDALERESARLPVEVPWALDVLATLGDAADALVELGVPGLFVVSPCNELLGVLSVADLLHAGVPVEALEPHEPVTQLRAHR